jgi:hypothetical protein
MAQIIDIQTVESQPIFLDELPPLNASSVAHILKNDCQMFPQNNK